MRSALEILARKRHSIDATADESAVIKSFFDQFHPIDSVSGRLAADLFMTEAAEWFEELERGDRPESRASLRARKELVALRLSLKRVAEIAQMSGATVTIPDEQAERGWNRLCSELCDVLAGFSHEDAL
jgi:hypothetical protein